MSEEICLTPAELNSVLSLACNIINAKLAAAKKLDLSLHEYMALLQLIKKEKLPVKELKTALDLPGGSATHILDSLEKRELVVRVRNARDRRQWFMELTADGKELCGKMLGIENAFSAEILASLGEQERIAFLKACDQLSSQRQQREF